MTSLARGALALVIGAAAAAPAPLLAQEQREGDVDERPRTNRLANEKSPYLRQHAANPVDWYPWGEAAFRRARAEEKPIFLSIGYATCHWCHVMERESFENEEVAAFLNEHFVAIKVDREERPDVDEVYMTAVQALTGSGGWPLSVFLTPGGEPFTGGTYFPQPARFGRRSFLDVLRVVQQVWDQDRGKVLESAQQITAHLRSAQQTAHPGSEVKVDGELLHRGVRLLAGRYDAASGGFGQGPTRFPLPHNLSFLLRYASRTPSAPAREMVKKTLDAMIDGGLRDHLGGGFHRYSTDPEWEIPHFEKMLYDQAGLVRALVEASQQLHEPRYAEVARETLAFVLEHMTNDGGGFTSAWDADSEGQEGKYYVWRAEELRGLLGEDYPLFAARYGVTDRGNFPALPGTTHLQPAASAAEIAARAGRPVAEVEAALERARARALAARRQRPAPLHDDKVLTDWNGLMIGAAAVAGRALGEPRFVAAAERAARFVLERLRDPRGALLHRWRDGEAAVPAMLDDYAFLTWGLLDLYEASYDTRWLQEAAGLARAMIAALWDEADGGFFQGAEGADLLYRPKPIHDGAIPAGNSAAALALLRLGRLTQDEVFAAKGRATLEWLAPQLQHAGASMTLALQAVDFAVGPTREVVIAGALDDPAAQALLREVRRRFLPRTVVVHRPPGEAEALAALVPFAREQGPREGRATAYVCRDYACQAPVHDPAALGALLEEAPADE